MLTGKNENIFSVRRSKFRIMQKSTFGWAKFLFLGELVANFCAVQIKSQRYKQKEN
jgi:hypothetical protein